MTSRLRGSLAVKILPPIPPDPPPPPPPSLRNTPQQFERMDPSTLTSEFISPSVHNEVITYFLSNHLPEHTTAESSPLEDFFVYYRKSFCHPTKEAATPPPFRDVVEEYLLFYVRRLDPYLASRAPLKMSQSTDEEPARWFFMEVLGLVGISWTKPWVAGDIFESFVVERWRHGFLRERHIRILKTIMRVLLVELETILELDAGFIGEGTRLVRNTEFVLDAESRRMREIERVCRRAYGVMGSYASERFRSERLEILLCRYFDEADQFGPNLQVGRGISAEEKKLEDADENVFGSFG